MGGVIIPMRIDFDTPVNAIMRADAIAYIDLDEGEMMHWKYIKREKLPNGKWRYYYRDTEYDEIKKKYLDTSRRQQEASDRFKKYSSFVDYYATQLDKANKGNKALTDANKNLQGWKEMRDKAGNESNAAYWELKRLKPQYEGAKKQYARSAGHKVADFLNKASDAIDKGKKWLKGLFT